MKKALIIISLAFIAISCGNKSGYNIAGNVSGIDGSVYLLSEYGDTLQSTTAKDGKFTLRGELDEPRVAYLSDNRDTFAMLFLENGKINVSGDNAGFGGVSVTGTLANDRNREFSAKRNSLVERFYTTDNDEEREAAMAEDELNANAAIDNNLDNFFGLYMVTEMTYGWSGQQTLDKLALFTEDLQNTSLGKDLREKAEAQKRTDVGQKYIDISLPDANGKTISLSSFIGAGKYILIDFWASWCPPCMEEIPYLKEAYKKYNKKGFEIFGISRDRNNQDWLNAVETHGMGWIQTIASGDSGNKVVADYSVSLIPTNFLIGPDGTILAKNLRGEQVAEKLSELLD